MTEQRLTEILERAADGVPVGPPPVLAMAGDAGRVRRRRTVVAILAGATAAVAVAVTSAALATPDRGAEPQQAATSPVPVTPPVGMRFVGVGHAAIAVPEDWGTNETRCGTPQRDTVVIDASVIPACSFRRPVEVDSVTLTTTGRRFDFTEDEVMAIDGVSADRQATTCEVGAGSREVCNGTVFIRSLNVSLRAESSTSAAEVDRILEQIRIVPGLVAVPGIESVNLFRQREAAEKYVTALQAAGLTAEVRTSKRPRLPTGYITQVEPQIGTMVAPGTSVLISVVAR